jgi:hypothetical protein
MSPELTAALALLGAITGVAGVVLAAWSLTWQVRTRRHAPSPNLRVELTMMSSKAYLFGGVVGDEVLIHITNEGPLPVTVAAVGFLAQAKDKRELLFGNLYVQPVLPAVVGPQQALPILLAFAGVRKAIALSKPAVAWVKADTGQRFLSPKTQVIRPGTSGYEENLKPTMPVPGFR